ncbi:TPA: hypothetical protein ACX6O5_004081 [Photobacterium damselae]
MNQMFIKLIVSLLLLGLFGCGGSDDDRKNTPSKEISINAQDTLKFSALNTKTTVDLRQQVQAQNSEPLLISDVKSINGDCDILSIDGLSFNIYARNADVCRFEYNVSPASNDYIGSASAVAQIVANADPAQGQYLPPISRTTLKNENIRFNSNDIVEPGYTLDSSSVVALNGTGTNEIGELSDISESGFNYIAPNTETIVRIFYSVINKTENIVKPGIIYIAVGQNTNISPNAQDKTLEAGTLLDENRIINIEDLVRDVDGDELQLVYARGIMGNINISGDLEFHYNSSSNGHEYVTYIVTDHNGGYGIGLLDFNISTYPLISDTTQELVFLPPMTLDSPELEVSSGSYYETGTNGFQGFYPIFNSELASSYCITKGGRLPTVLELTTMWKNVINEPMFQSKFKWHSSSPYLTNTESKQVSLIDGKEILRSDPSYFSCVISTKEPKWEFSQPFSHIRLGVPSRINEIANLDDGTTIYRDIDDYKLQAKTVQYLINGTVADPDDVDLKINRNYITVDTKNVGPKDSIYIKVEVTDDDIIGQTKTLVLGVNQCKVGTTPEQSLEEACIYTIGAGEVRFTLAIPTNILGTPPDDFLNDKYVEIFGQNGVSFIGNRLPNNDKWRGYIQDVCEEMNTLKIDGITTWAAGRNVANIPAVLYITNKDDHEASKRWIKYMRDRDPEHPYNSYFGQGFASSSNTEIMVYSQLGNQNQIYRQARGSAVTFASCVSQ